MITVFVDKSFSFETKTPPASYYIMKAAKLDKGAKTTGSEVVGAVTRKQLEEIAEIKMVDMNANDIDGAVSTLSGSARSMGVQVRG